MKAFKSLVSVTLSLIMILASFGTASADAIDLYSNGNPVEENTYSSGILTAKSTGDGIFAIAQYKNDELIKISLAEDYTNVGMAVTNDTTVTTKIFRFLPDGTPLCVNKEPTYEEKAEKRIYANENFNNGTRLNMSAATAATLENNRLTVTGNDTRLPTIAIFEADRYVVAEGTFTLPDTTVKNIDFINIYNGSPLRLVYMTKASSSYGYSNIYTADGNSIRKYGGIYGGNSTSELTAGLKISVVLDMQNITYNVYINGEKATSSAVSFADIIGDKGNNFSFMYARTREEATVYVDDIEIYSTNDGSLSDLGNEVPNVHRTDFPSSRLASDTYDRPDYKTIAALASAKEHPRIMINAAKIAEIKNSADARMIDWKNKVLAQADALLTTEPYNYITQDGTSIGGVDIGLERVMTLGMAYNLKGDDGYVTRAYAEITQLNTKYPVWGNRKALSVGEASVMHAVCYDWMFDALTTEQKNYLKTTVMTQALIPAYKTYHGQYVSDISVDTNKWYTITNNWNAVCNGGFLTASLAFMEADMFTCATLAEACLRGLEYMMAVYAPGGAWAEGAMYWGYTTKYVTIAAASLETSCGSLYGLDGAEGFDKTSLFGLSLEGNTSVMNFGDAASSHVDAPFMLYWSRIYDEPTYTAAAIYSMERFGFEPNVFDLIYYTPAMAGGAFIAPEAYYFEGTENVMFTSGDALGDTAVAMSGGLGHATSHDHLDSGAVIADMKGVRILADIGAEHYDAGGYFTDDRHKLFKARPEAHNIFVINPEKITDTDDTTEYFGQYKDATSSVTCNESGKTATMDLSAAYGRDASAASRTLFLDGADIIINDAITLKETSNVYWNWYFEVPISDIVISSDNKSAAVTKDGETFTISFETASPYTLEVQEAQQYVDTEPDDDTPRHSTEDFRRLVVKFTSVSGSISLKTTIK